MNWLTKVKKRMLKRLDEGLFSVTEAPNEDEKLEELLCAHMTR